jgi:SAM-dependent methyltransferase
MSPPPDPYANPLLYDLEYSDYTKDLEYYIALCKHVGSPVLELGCGNGRLSIPIAKAGLSLIGVDISQRMLEHFEQKLKQLSPEVQERIQLVCADFRTLQSKQLFPIVIVPFNSIHHCSSIEEVSALLRTGFQALVPGGYLALDCYLIDRKLYDRDPNERYEPRWFNDPSTKERLYSWEQSSWEEETQIHHVNYFYQHSSGAIQQSKLSLHMYERELLKDTFQAAGFSICQEWSDFESGKVGSHDHKWVCVLRQEG